MHVTGLVLHEISTARSEGGRPTTSIIETVTGSNWGQAMKERSDPRTIRSREKTAWTHEKGLDLGLNNVSSGSSQDSRSD
jgi:hypothetical protein